MFWKRDFFPVLVAAGALVGCSGAATSSQRSVNRDPSPAGAPAPVRHTEPTADARPQPIEQAAAPDQNGRLLLDAGDLAFRISVPACRDFGADIVLCDEAVALSVARQGGASQSIELESLYINTQATLFRGALDQRDRSQSHSVIVADVNADGHDDLALWTGRNGGYGGASYGIYLFDPSRNNFAYSQAFSDLTVGTSGFFTIEDRKIRTGSKSGCCLHVEETFVVERSAPVLVERIERDSSGGANPSKRTLYRRIEGQMQQFED